MANRTGDMGMDVAINRRLNSKYEAESERESIEWVNTITGEKIELGMQNVQKALKDGRILCILIEKVYNDTPTLPPETKKIHRPIKFNTMSAPFKQMENIQKFLTAAAAYGVPKASMFQTVDLFESRNMAQVLNTLLQLGTECQRNGFSGPVCGPKPSYENKREFTQEQLRASEGIIGLQAGTNKCASQKGMSMGGARHVADIKVDDMSAEGQTTLGLQMGSNKGASQAGMSMGAARHISDIKVDKMSDEGLTTLGLQAGTNKFASQKGMSMGAVRHIADIRADDMTKDAQGVIGLQAGSNKGASQTGMRIGTQRFISDVKADAEMSKDGSSVIGLQMGPDQSQVASQSGMSFGAQRKIMDSH